MRHIQLIILFIASATLVNAQTAEQLYRRIGENVSAGDTNVYSDMNELLSLYEQRFSKKSSQYADALIWTAKACAKAGDLKQAKRLLDESDALFRCYGSGPFAGRDTVSEMFRLDLRSDLEYMSGSDFVALKLSSKSLLLKKAHFGEQSETYLNALLDLSRLYAERLKYLKSSRYHNMGYKAYVERIKTEFCSTSESERIRYWEKASKYINKTIEIAHHSANKSSHGGDQSLAAAAYNALLLSKGILLNTSIGFENFINESQNKEAMDKLAQKKHFSAQGTSQTVLDSLDFVIMEALRKKGQTYTIPQLSITWKDVAAHLKKDDLAIEFYRTITNEYGAILLRHDWDTPRVVRLSSFVAVGENYKSLDHALANNPFNSYSAADSEKLWSLSKAVWPDDIVKHFPKFPAGRIFFSADGELQVTGIEYLPFIRPEADGSFYTISDLYNIYRLSSTRELALSHEDPDGKDVAVYGGLLYKMTDQAILADMKQYNNLHQHEHYLAHRGAIVEDDSIRFLIGTKIEADSILTTINRNRAQGLNAIPYLFDRGTEASFKALNGHRPRIVHLATHGFYFNEGDSATYNRFLPKADNLSASLTRSGLYMAGSESRFKGKPIPQGAEDGILTSYEVSMMDLRGLDLVALSACETAKGDISPDGVFGIQRGFKMASAQSILMSLWKVDDEATCLLMTEFYKNWIGEGKTKHDALELAKQTVRSHKEKGWDNPQYWAAFILLDALD